MHNEVRTEQFDEKQNLVLFKVVFFNSVPKALNANSQNVFKRNGLNSFSNGLCHIIQTWNLLWKLEIKIALPSISNL